MRVGGPPKGPPPTGAKPGAPPRGPPPTGGRRPNSKAVPSKSPGAAAAKGGAKGASQAPAANSNIPQAPPIGHFFAYLKGNYDPANPPSDTGAPAIEIPRQSEDLHFNPAEQMGGDMMGQADTDELAGMLDAMGDVPAVERSSMSIPVEDNDPNKPPKPLE
mmetsp:Transcript_38954/g.50984  ORF Transcript_38954/g.50984 Transcript_38954/m.50984 type:complete len:161 (+) Transcript_38954:1801-2283(+)